MVVDKGDNPLNFVDPSGTAMFVYSIQRGVELGLLKAKEYTPVAYRGYQSLFPFIQVNDRGLLDVIGACDGVVIKRICRICYCSQNIECQRGCCRYIVGGCYNGNRTTEK